MKKCLSDLAVISQNITEISGSRSYTQKQHIRGYVNKIGIPASLTKSFAPSSPKDVAIGYSPDIHFFL